MTASLWPTLAVSGSNLSGDVPFSAALCPAAGAENVVRSSPTGQRGDLAELCAELCAACGVAPAQLARIVVDVGPGSYTGLRVAVTFVRFLQAFGDAVVEAVDSLAVLARHALADGDGRDARPLLDARRGRYHTGCYRLRGGVLQVLEAPAAVPVDAALARLATGQLVVAPAPLAERLRGSLPAGCELHVAAAIDAAALLSPGLPTAAARAADLEPRYLMASYAEE